MFKVYVYKGIRLKVYFRETVRLLAIRPCEPKALKRMDLKTNRVKKTL